MTQSKRLLISGIGKRNYLLSLLKAECSNLGIKIVGADANLFPPARVEVDEFCQLPYASDPSFIERYKEVISQYNIDAGITLIDPEITIISNAQERGELGSFNFLHPTYQSAILCEDKLDFAKKLKSRGIGHVSSFETPPDIDIFISKDRYGSAASGFFVHKNNSFVPTDRNDNIIYQPFISGIHYCVDAYFDLATSNLRDICVKEVLDKSSGESFLVKSVNPSPFLEICYDINDTIPLRGIVNLDIYEHDGQYLCMEVNCRIGGNYPASHGFGVNLIRHLLKDSIGAGTQLTGATQYEQGLFVGKYYAFTEPFSTTRSFPN